MIIENEYTIKLSEIGKENKVTNRAILSYLEDIAGIHSNLAGCGIFDMEKIHLSWILLGWKLHVIKRPKYNEKIIIKTWSKGIVKFYTYRDFEIYDKQGNLIVTASSKWILLDNQRGKIVRMNPEMTNKYEPELDKRTFDMTEFENIKEPESYQYETEYTVRRADIDGNNHVHNLNYIEIANEALPEDVYRGALFKDVKVIYKKEMKLGDTVKCKYSFCDDNHIVVIKSVDEKIIHAIIEMR